MYSVSSTTQYVVIDLDRDSRDGAQAETASAFYLPKHLSSQQGFNFLQWNLLAWIINLLGFFVCFNGSCCCCEDMPSTILLILRQFA